MRVRPHRCGLASLCPLDSGGCEISLLAGSKAEPEPPQVRQVARAHLSMAISPASPAFAGARRRVKSFQPRPLHEPHGAAPATIEVNALRT